MSVSDHPRLTLSILEQPSKLHRFRFLKEIKGDRMGSVLHGRSSQKAPVKVTVAAAEPPSPDVKTLEVKLIGCTVFEDLMPHPFYLLGDNCSDGGFQKEISLSAPNFQCDVSLECIGIVCTPKKKSGKAKRSNVKQESEQEDTYQQRLNTWNFFNKKPRADPFQGKDVNKLRLAFQLFVRSAGSQLEWVPANCNPVSTDVIADAKMHSQLRVDCVNPKTVTSLTQDVWLYMKDPLPAGPATRFTVVVKSQKQGVEQLKLVVKSLKKHLIVFNISDLKELQETQTLHLQVVDNDSGEESETVPVGLSLPAEPMLKKQRRENPTTEINHIEEQDCLSELMKGYATEDQFDDPHLQSSGIVFMDSEPADSALPSNVMEPK